MPICHHNIDSSLFTLEINCPNGSPKLGEMWQKLELDGGDRPPASRFPPSRGAQAENQSMDKVLAFNCG
jgi:hypothetical protein